MGTKVHVHEGDIEAFRSRDMGGVDELDQLLELLPEQFASMLQSHHMRDYLIEIVMDLGRRPYALFKDTSRLFGETEIDELDLSKAESILGEFGKNNRTGIPGTLHRISALRSKTHELVGLTLRVGRAIAGNVDILDDLIQSGASMLLLGKPGVGKTSIIREISRVLADEHHKRVVVVDSCNEIAGDGDIPHPAIGGARRMQIPAGSTQAQALIQAVENHMPEVLIVDEISTRQEVENCQTIAERGVTLIATAHGHTLENVMKNPVLCNLLGGISTVLLSAEETSDRKSTTKTVQERKTKPTFPIVIEMHDHCSFVVHWAEDSVDLWMRKAPYKVQLREKKVGMMVVESILNDSNTHSDKNGSGDVSPALQVLQALNPKRKKERQRGNAYMP